MTYNKPNVALLGSAANVIEQLVKDGDNFSDQYTQQTGLKGDVITVHPAYDLDE